MGRLGVTRVPASIHFHIAGRRRSMSAQGQPPNTDRCAAPGCVRFDNRAGDIMRQAESSVANVLAGVVPDTIARLLPDRATIVRVFRFGVSGVVATGVHVALAMLLITAFSATQVEANGVAFVCANVCSYLLNALWAFSARPGRDNFLRFFCVSVFGLLLTLAISWAAQKAGANYWTGLAAILMTVPPITFLLHRFWTFR
ncbi:hypothetical protein LMG10661_03414 [Ralstonia syzygii subsp. syzygii]|nr:hypothetical protein LMG10661_03414 [Ralstonia syzygii subsp. syzygii]